jgi:tricorn protease
MTRRLLLAASSLALVLLGLGFGRAPALVAQTPAEARLLRFPAIHGNQIVFTYAGDLYTVPASGGTARRLTSDVGFEMFARFSPDGRSIAFTGQYDGNTEVYLMPAEGGVPKRLTYTPTLDRDEVSDRMGPNNIVIAWKDDKDILFRSRQRDWNDFKGNLYTIARDGGTPALLPLPRGGFGTFSPDGKRLAYNRIFREFRTWKRYRGGMADDVWIYDFASKQTTRITNDPAQDIYPMWAGNAIYFFSDRGDAKRMNLYRYDLGTQQTAALTTFTEFDIKFPSLGDNAIVFENGGYIYRFDLQSQQAAKVPISIQEDLDSGRGQRKDVGNTASITNFEIGPDGNRALFGARGDVFTVPAKNGPTRNLTATPGVHERNSKWSPDGRWISYISDASGEDEIYVAPQDGKGAAVKVTSGGDTYKYQPIWSPDSKKLLWADKKLRLQYVDVDAKTITPVAQATAFEFSDYAWAPDSKWIAYAKPQEQSQTTVHLFGLDDKKTLDVTDGWEESSEPSFSADGKFLFFVSNRTFTPRYGALEFEHVYTDMAKIYLVTLAKDTKSPLGPVSDEVKVEEKKVEPPMDASPSAQGAAKAPAKPAPRGKDAKQDDKKGDSKDEKKDEKKEDKAKPVQVKVEADGLQGRIAVLPIAASSYSNLQSVGDKLFYSRSGSRDERRHLLVYDFGAKKETDLGEFRGYEIAAGGKKMLVADREGYGIIDLPSAKIELKERLNLSDMKVTLDRHAEWTQIFNESWRQMRDFFFSPNMNGVDWPAVKAKYAALLPYVNHRADLTYIIGEMIGELNSGHAYVGGGDLPEVKRVPMGTLGAIVERDAASKAFRITHIYKGQNWDSARRSPLTEIGVDAKEGDYILAVNGRPASELGDLQEALVDTVNKQVVLTLNSKPATAGSRDVTVLPIANEHELRYHEWVRGNYDKVTKATGGRAGYVHVPDMGVPGLNEFAAQFYPQVGKAALVIDVRGNGGGNVSPMIIDRLRRELAMVDIARNTAPSPDPGALILGPKVALADEFSASDGDLFTYRFKVHKIGPVIGKRTWGGVVGIRGTLPFLDGGSLNRPEFSRYDVEGKTWIIEGHGVDPDIEVDNDPAKEFAGEDQQLDRAIVEIIQALKARPVELAKPPAPPVK